MYSKSWFMLKRSLFLTATRAFSPESIIVWGSFVLAHHRTTWGHQTDSNHKYQLLRIYTPALYELKQWQIDQIDEIKLTATKHKTKNTHIFLRWLGGAKWLDVRLMINKSRVWFLPDRAWLGNDSRQDVYTHAPLSHTVIWSRPITFLWLWPVTDQVPHCWCVPINKIWRRTMAQSYNWNLQRLQHTQNK